MDGVEIQKREIICQDHKVLSNRMDSSQFPYSPIRCLSNAVPHSITWFCFDLFVEILVIKHPVLRIRPKVLYLNVIPLVFAHLEIYIWGKGMVSFSYHILLAS